MAKHAARVVRVQAARLGQGEVEGVGREVLAVTGVPEVATKLRNARVPT